VNTSASAHSLKATSTHAVRSRIRDVHRVLPDAARPIAAGVGIGIAIGAATALAQPHLGPPWSALVNSASPWLLGGFAAGALAGGPVSGLAGWAWRRGTGRARAYGAALPPGTFIAEAVGAYGFRLHYRPAVALFLLIGVALLCLLIRRVPPAGFVAWTVVFVVAGALVYGPLLDAVAGTSSGGVNYGP
jgi:hypothetical protein